MSLSPAVSKHLCDAKLQASLRQGLKNSRRYRPGTPSIRLRQRKGLVATTRPLAFTIDSHLTHEPITGSGQEQGLERP